MELIPVALLAIGQDSQVLEAAASPVRLQILKLLSSKGPMPYSEIMFSLKFNPMRDAGKFVYHLKSLTNAGLLRLDKESKKYEVTELGRMVVEFARDVSGYLLAKSGRLFVRTSDLAIEEFERDKIVKALVEEANMPLKVARDIAEEAEERLLSSKTTYLTAPLIREFINAILIEKGLEEYRHKLTRLGMPVFDVTRLMIGPSSSQSVGTIKERAGNRVMEEYTLLSALPRSVADSHLSGNIHLDCLGDWILRPEEFAGDLRTFLRLGLPFTKPPKDFGSALQTIAALARASSEEVSKEAFFPMFNIFMAPFAEGVSDGDLEEAIYFFLNGLRWDLLSYNPRGKISFGLDLSIPSFLADVDAIGPGGRISGRYSDYRGEAHRIFEHILASLAKSSQHRPAFSPRFVIGLRPSDLKSPRLKELLAKALDLANRYGLLYFSLSSEEERISRAPSGSRLSDDWSGNWEVDCLKSGIIGSAFINLPRIAYEARGNDERFMDLLSDRFGECVEALRIKSDGIGRRRKEGFFPLLASKMRNFVMEGGVHLVGLIGLYEAVKAHTGSAIPRDKGSMKFALKVLEHLKGLSKSHSEELELRISIAQRGCPDGSSRLARLDLGSYGVSTISVEGPKKHPRYTDVPTMPLTLKISLKERAESEAMFQKALPGGHFLQICLDPGEKGTKGLCGFVESASGFDLRFFAFGRSLTYCGACAKSFLGIFSKCPACEGGDVEVFAMESSEYIPLRLWNDATKRELGRRVLYLLSGAGKGGEDLG
ncbi:MAG: anaerobic ribonucleoside-triphosphate reductase [Candidatus Bathyarchaeia archaeon]